LYRPDALPDAHQQCQSSEGNTASSAYHVKGIPFVVQELQRPLFISHPGQLSLLFSAGREMSTGQSVVMHLRLASKKQA